MQNMEEIYQRYFETVNKYLFCLTRNADLAEELTQETFYRAVKKINSFQENCKMSVWLCQIAKHIWYNELKKNKKIKLVSEEEIWVPTGEMLEDTIISNEDKIELYRKIEDLGEPTRSVIYMRIAGELSFQEIADVLNKTESWARVTFYRGKQKLKEGD